MNADNGTSENFLTLAQGRIHPELCKSVQKLTQNQADSPLWHELRYACITASKLHAAAHCNTFDGSLVESILSAKLMDSEAMRRGRRLKGKVLKVLFLKNWKKTIKKSGLLLCVDHPLFGASPDGIGDDFIAEVQCLMSEKTFKRYFSSEGGPAKRHYAQMQLQMYFAKKT